jgi:hypothetical protein
MSAEGMDVVCWGVGAMTAVVLGFGAICAVYSIIWNRDTNQKLLKVEKVYARDAAVFHRETETAQQRRPTPSSGRARHELRRVMATAIFTKLEENEITKA